MRIISAVLAALLILFAAVQWNDPDGPIWIVIYGIGAIWCLIAAAKPWLFGAGPVAGLYGLCLIAAVAGMVYFWPEVSNWWDIDVWWPEITGETSREGMGMMVLVVCLAVAGWTMLRARRHQVP